jgi:hypothetical protein
VNEREGCLSLYSNLGGWDSFVLIIRNGWELNEGSKLEILLPKQRQVFGPMKSALCRTIVINR